MGQNAPAVFIWAEAQEGDKIMRAFIQEALASRLTNYVTENTVKYVFVSDKTLISSNVLTTFKNRRRNLSAENYQLLDNFLKIRQYVVTSHFASTWIYLLKIVKTTINRTGITAYKKEATISEKYTLCRNGCPQRKLHT